MARDIDERRLRAEALRVYHRYATEVVEALGLCPWAQSAREQGRVRPHVVLSAAPGIPGVDEVLACMDALFADRGIDIGLLIFPCCPWDRLQFRHFAAQVRARDSERHAPGLPPVAVADFHPHAQLDMSTPARLVSFIRRTPDPTLQLVRRSALHAMQHSGVQGTVYAPRALLSAIPPGPEPVSPHQRMAAANHATITRMGAARVAALLDDIRADRDRAYGDCSAIAVLNGPAKGPQNHR